jgi:hypothetical protein
MTCQKCADKGAIKVNYYSREPFDLALCDCDAGQMYRGWLLRDGEGLLRVRFPGADQIGHLEDFEDEAEGSTHPGGFLSAAQTVKPKAKL